MLVAAALCPSAPLLVPGLGGPDPTVAALRAATAQAVAALRAAGPDVVAVVGAAPATSTWPADTAVDFGPFHGAATTAGPALPLALAVGAAVLRDAGYGGPPLFQGVAPQTGPDACVAL